MKSNRFVAVTGSCDCHRAHMQNTSKVECVSQWFFDKKLKQKKKKYFYFFW